jgi:hypothetical protein
VEGCGNSGPGSDKVCPTDVSNRVCCSNGLKRASKHQCEEEGPEGVRLAHPAGRDNVNNA